MYTLLFAPDFFGRNPYLFASVIGPSTAFAPLALTVESVLREIFGGVLS